MSAHRLVSTLWRSVSIRLMAPFVDESISINSPILTNNQIQDYAKQLDAIAAKLPANPKQSSAMRQGEQPSRYMGAGMEYEESRPYEIGDEIRRINWKLMAKTGKAYTKLYQEERQESWFILVDHRSSMRFSTRSQLKATQAARLAGYFAWQAQQAGIPVSVARLADSFEQSPIFEGRSAYSQIMQAVSKPCPPKQANEKEPLLNDVLLNLNHQLQPGSRLILLSDFHDLDDRSSEILTAMQDFLLIKAVLIQDLAETRIPDLTGLQLQSIVDGRNYQIASKSQRASFQAWSQDYFEDIANRLRVANVSYYQLSTEADLTEINQVLSAGIGLPLSADKGRQYG
jgi:hypothetical protein